MDGEQLSRFVDLLETGKVQAADFHTLSPEDWAEVKKLLEARRRYTMQKYVNAVFACRIKGLGGRSGAARTYTEEEILSEFGSKG